MILLLMMMIPLVALEPSRNNAEHGKNDTEYKGRHHKKSKNLEKISKGGWALGKKQQKCLNLNLGIVKPKEESSFFRNV